MSVVNCGKLREFSTVYYRHQGEQAPPQPTKAQSGCRKTQEPKETDGPRRNLPKRRTWQKNAGAEGRAAAPNGQPSKL